MEINRTNKLRLAILLAISGFFVFIIVVNANTDLKSKMVYISTNYTEIREVGVAGDCQNGQCGHCNWLNNNIDSSASSYRVIDPSSCWTVCQANGALIQRINPGKAETTNWYQSLNAYPTYHNTICMSMSGNYDRVVNANAHHFIWHDGGVFDSWTSVNHTITCTTCNP